MNVTHTDQGPWGVSSKAQHPAPARFTYVRLQKPTYDNEMVGVWVYYDKGFGSSAATRDINTLRRYLDRCCRRYGLGHVSAETHEETVVIKGPLNRGHADPLDPLSSRGSLGLKRQRIVKHQDQVAS